MTQVTLQGREMSAKDAAEIVAREVESRGGNQWAYMVSLGEILNEWCEPDARFSVKDAVYQQKLNARLN